MVDNIFDRWVLEYKNNQVYASSKAKEMQEFITKVSSDLTHMMMAAEELSVLHSLDDTSLLRLSEIVERITKERGLK